MLGIEDDNLVKQRQGGVMLTYAKVSPYDLPIVYGRVGFIHCSTIPVQIQFKQFILVVFIIVTSAAPPYKSIGIYAAMRSGHNMVYIYIYN